MDRVLKVGVAWLSALNFAELKHFGASVVRSGNVKKHAVKEQVASIAQAASHGSISIQSSVVRRQFFQPRSKTKHGTAESHDNAAQARLISVYSDGKLSIPRGRHADAHDGAQADDHSLLSLVDGITRIQAINEGDSSMTAFKTVEEFVSELVPQVTLVRQRRQNHLERLLMDFPIEPFEVNATRREYLDAFERHTECRRQQLVLERANEACAKDVAEKQAIKTRECQSVMVETNVSKSLKRLVEATESLSCEEATFDVEEAEAACLRTSILHHNQTLVSNAAQEKVNAKACLAWAGEEQFFSRCDAARHHYQEQVAFDSIELAAATSRLRGLESLLCASGSTACNGTTLNKELQELLAVNSTFSPPDAPTCPIVTQLHPCTDEYADALRAASPAILLKPCRQCFPPQS
jgi:hypothetical protein